MEKLIKKLKYVSANHDPILGNDEIVFEGHPDALCDSIAEKITKKLIRSYDSKARVALEVLYDGKEFILGGEVYVDPKRKRIIENEVQALILEEIWKTSQETPRVIIKWREQSEEIYKGSLNGFGDNTIAYGYYNGETKSRFTPARVKLLEIKEKIKKFHPITYIDGKLLLIKEGNKDVIHISIEEGLSEEQLRNLGINGNITIFKKSGGSADTGVVGRKLIASRHGNGVPHGGGAFAGKDLTKGDKSLKILADVIAKQTYKATPEIRDVLVQLSCIFGSNKINVLIKTGSESFYNGEMESDENLLNTIKKAYMKNEW